MRFVKNSLFFEHLGIEKLNNVTSRIDIFIEKLVTSWENVNFEILGDGKIFVRLVVTDSNYSCNRLLSLNY